MSTRLRLVVATAALTAITGLCATAAPATSAAASLPGIGVSAAGASATAGLQSRRDRQDRRSRARGGDAAEDAGASFAAGIRTELKAIVDGIAAGDEVGDARETVDALFDRVVAWADASDGQLFRDVALTRRLVMLAESLDPSDRGPMMAYLADAPNVAAAVAFAWDPRFDEPRRVVEVLARLARAAGSRLERYPELTAAICVVHDQPMTRRINENRTSSAAPEEILAFYVNNERSMAFGLRDLPAELLMHVVDTTDSLADLSWANDQYGRRTDVGRWFFEISYDTEHFRGGRTKRVTEQGFTLPNIRQFGGVCADQAYYAMGVAKSRGIPATYVTGRSGSVGHAWVGFVQNGRGGPGWNFDAGRYEEYQGVRGEVLDPQSRRQIPDSYLATTVSTGQVSVLDRQISTALVDAADRLAEVRTGVSRQSPAPRRRPGAAPPTGAAPVKVTWPPTIDGSPAEAEAEAGSASGDAAESADDAPALDPTTGALTEARLQSVEAQLDLLRASLERCPTRLQAWESVQQLATTDALSLDQKRLWAEAVSRLCGNDWPDLYLDIVSPMVKTFKDAEQQTTIWDGVFEQVAGRKDLEAEIRRTQGELWKSTDPRRAVAIFEDTAVRYANDGPFAIDALSSAIQLHRQHGTPASAAQLTDRAFKQARKPRGRVAGVFGVQSNWYRIGRIHERSLREAGRGRDANNLGEQLNRFAGID